MNQKKIKVLLVVRWPVGGIRTFLKYVYSQFSPNVFDIEIMAADTVDIPILKNDLRGVVSDWHLFSSDSKGLRSSVFLLIEVLKARHFDLIHAHGFTSLVLSTIPSKIFGIPLICTIHDLLLTTQFVGYRGVIKKFFLGRCLKSCRLVQSVTCDAQSNLKEFFPSVRDEKLIVILSGVNSEYFLQAKPINIRSDYDLAGRSPIIGFFGRFMGQKGFRFLVEAIEHLKNEKGYEKIHVVCLGSGGYIREDKDYISNAQLSEQFSFFPFAADISGFMKGCDIVVMPSRWEACGLLAMEALCAGVPFVGTNCLGLREVMKGTPAVQVETANAMSLAEGIEKCYEIGPVPFLEYAPIAAERFDVKNTSFMLQDTYKKILE